MKCALEVVSGVVNEESGQDVIEYALILAFIGAGTIASVKSLSNSVATTFSAVGTTVTSSF